MSELKHYGVKGMKWGVRRSEYKAMNRQQRKATKKRFLNTSEGKVIRNIEIATFLLGPIGGLVAGQISAKKYGTSVDKAARLANSTTDKSFRNKKIKNFSKNTTNKGKKKVEQYKNTKIETDEQKITRLMKEGKINPNAHHYFDQNGNLFMVTWDD